MSEEVETLEVVTNELTPEQIEFQQKMEEQAKAQEAFGRDYLMDTIKLYKETLYSKCVMMSNLTLGDTLKVKIEDILDECYNNILSAVNAGNININIIQELGFMKSIIDNNGYTVLKYVDDKDTNFIHLMMLPMDTNTPFTGKHLHRVYNVETCPDVYPFTTKFKVSIDEPNEDYGCSEEPSTETTN